jgi:hypothetical protein
MTSWEELKAKELEAIAIQEKMAGEWGDFHTADIFRRYRRDSLR